MLYTYKCAISISNDKLLNIKVRGLDSIFFKAITKHPEIIATVFESLPEPTFLINHEGYYVETWGGTDTKRHHNPSLLVGLHLSEILPADKIEWFSQVIKQALETHEACELEYELDPKQLPCFKGIEGPTQVQYFSAFVVPLTGYKHVLWTVRNITEYKLSQIELVEQQKRFERLSTIDHLTQTYNRFALEKLLPQALIDTQKNNISASLFMIDIDCFKDLNDLYGHLKGDDALTQVSRTIMNWCGSNGYCFRFGGDEFLVFRQGLAREECLKLGWELSRSVKNLNIPNKNSEVGERLSITIGIEHCEQIPENINIERFIAIADQALFHAKNLERGTVHIFNKRPEC